MLYTGMFLIHNDRQYCGGRKRAVPSRDSGDYHSQVGGRSSQVTGRSFQVTGRSSQVAGTTGEEAIMSYSNRKNICSGGEHPHLTHLFKDKWLLVIHRIDSIGRNNFGFEALPDCIRGQSVHVHFYVGPHTFIC